jgi:uncharacterized phage protein gp47/JayE
MAGLTIYGFETKTLDDIIAEVEADERDLIGNPALNVSAPSAIGQINGVIGSKIAELWDLAQAVYAAFDPNSATGQSLASLSLLTGTVKRGATKSQLTAVTVNLNAGVTLAAGSVAHVVNNPDARFVTKTSATNSGGAAANVAVDMEAETAGPVQALAGTLTVIAQPVTGWNSVTNPTDAVVGKDAETDPELRTRRESELAASGSSTVDAMRADILRNLPVVTSVSVIENVTDVADSDGRPPHSIEVIARGPDAPTTADNDALAAQVFDSLPEGIQAYGTTTRTVVDSQGQPHTIGFTRPTVRPVYLAFDLVINTDPKAGQVYPADGDTQVKAAVAAVGDTNYGPGSDVILRRLEVAVFSVPGVLDITATRAGFTASPVGTVNLVIGAREVADIDTGRITISTVAG